jgi:hypothetical protein
MKVQEREDETEREIKIIPSPEKLEVPLESADLGSSMTSSGFLDENTVVKSSASSSKSKLGSTRRSPTMNTLPRAAPTVTADTTPATATVMASTAASIAAPPSSLSSSTVGALLDQLRTLHDDQQAAQTAEWNAFLKKRRQGGTLLGFIGTGDAEGESDEEKEWGMGIVGVGRMDPASAKEFARLVRGGVPLVYRDKVVSLSFYAASCVFLMLKSCF